MEKLLTPEQLSESLGVKLSTIYSWTHKKIIPRAANIRLLRFRESEVLEWLKSQPSESKLKKSKNSPRSRAKNVSRSTAAIDLLVSAAKKKILK